MREYGKPTIARLRLDGLTEAAAKFFIKRSSQEREGELQSIIMRLRHFASRRNEVAHGIVLNIQNIAVFTDNFVPEARGKKQYALIAPYYQIKQHGPDGLPAYAYTRPVLASMIPAMVEPMARLVRFRRALVPRASARSAPSPPSAAINKKKRQSALQKRARRQQRRSR